MRIVENNGEIDVVLRLIGTPPKEMWGKMRMGVEQDCQLRAYLFWGDKLLVKLDPNGVCKNEEEFETARVRKRMVTWISCDNIWVKFAGSIAKRDEWKVYIYMNVINSMWCESLPNLMKFRTMVYVNS